MLYMVQLFLKNSADLTLTLVVSIMWSRGYITKQSNILNELVQHTHRWGVVRFLVSGTGYRWLYETQPGDFPRLTEIALVAPYWAERHVDRF